MDNLTLEQLRELRLKLRDALLSGNYGKFGTYANTERLLLAAIAELDARSREATL
jgi:hypothetical protein